MTKRGNDAGKHQLCLPLDEFLNREAARRAPDREPRQVGACLPTNVRDVIEKVGQRRREGDEGSRNASGLNRGLDVAPRNETGKKAQPEGRASLHKGNNDASNAVETLPSTTLDRQRNAHAGCVVIAFICPSRESHYASSGTWIEF